MGFSVHPTKQAIKVEGTRQLYASEIDVDFESPVPPLPPDNALRWSFVAAVVLPLLGISVFVSHLIPDRIPFQPAPSESVVAKDNLPVPTLQVAAFEHQVASSPPSSNEMAALALRRALELRAANASLTPEQSKPIPLPKPRPKIRQ